MPVYDGAPDNVVGYVNLREALARVALQSDLTFDSMIRPVPFVPDSISAPVLLRKLQQDRAQLAIVIDERGSVVGLVTVEDLVEELFGEIMSENDKPASVPVREPDGAWVIAASLPIHEINRILPLELPEGRSRRSAACACTSRDRFLRRGRFCTPRTATRSRSWRRPRTGCDGFGCDGSRSPTGTRGGEVAGLRATATPSSLVIAPPNPSYLGVGPPHAMAIRRRRANSESVCVSALKGCR